MKKEPIDIDSCYITIQGWMVSRLGLCGNELLVYAIVFGFCQDGERDCRCSLAYISTLLNIGRATVIRTLATLEERGLIIRLDASPGKAVHYGIKGVSKCNGYQNDTGIKMRREGYQNETGTGIKMRPDNKIDNTNDTAKEETNKEERAAVAAMSSAVADADAEAATTEPISSESPAEPEPLTPTPSPKEWTPKEFIEFFNSTITAAKSIIPAIKSVAGMRLSFLHARTREHGKEAVKTAITKAAASDFLNGKGGRGFIANCDWILRPNNMPKILEGNYDNRSPLQAAQNNGYAYPYYNDPRRSTPVRPHTDEDYNCDF